MKARRRSCLVMVALMLLTPLAAATGTAGGHEGGQADGGGSRQAGGPLGDEDAMVQYAILTSFTLAEEFQRLAQWKTQKGVYAKVYATDWVRNNYPDGPDNSHRYQSFLRDLYNHTDGGLRYVLLGGDDEVVRAREIWTGIKPGWDPYSGAWVYSDHYYAGLDHDWDLDGDGKYGELGETDWDAEVSLGRAPVSTVVEAENVVDKLLSYERSPEVGDWMRRMVLVSSVMNPPNANISNAHHPDHIYKWWEDNAWESIERTVPLVPVHMDQHVLYDYNQTYGGNYTPVNDTLNRQSYTAALDMGSSCFASVTHGWIPTGNGIPHYVGDGVGFNWSSAFYWTNISSTPPDGTSLNNGNKTPFIYFSSCYVGNFTEANDTNFEKLFTMASGGAIGLIAPSENTYRGEENPGASDGNWWMSENFWRHLFQDEQRPGDAFYDMIREYEPHLRSVDANPDSPYFRQNHAAYNLIGDPEMPVWLDTPGQLTVGVPQNIYDLDYDVEVRVSEGALPVEGARVCFKGEDFYAFGDTNATGHATLHISPGVEAQSVTVTVTAPQYTPFQTTMGVTPAPAELTVLENTIRASTTRPEAGVPTELKATISNIGHSDALSFSVRFYDGDPGAGGTPVGDSVDVPGLQGKTDAPVSVTWDEPTAGLHEIFVMVDSEDDIEEIVEEDNLASAKVRVTAENVRVQSVGVEGVTGTPALPYGKESTVTVTLVSTGSVAVGPVAVRLYLGDPGLDGEVVGPDRSVPSVPSGATRSVTFPFTPEELGLHTLVAVADPEDELAEFNEMDNSAEVEVKVGHPPIWEPIPGVIMLEDTPKEFDVTRYMADYDTPREGLEVSVSAISTNKVEVTVAGRVVRIHPMEDWFGEFDLTLALSDGDFETLTTVRVNVTASNDAPRFRNTVHNATVREGEAFRFEFEAYDPDGDSVHFSDNSELFDITSAGVIDFTPTFEDIGYSPLHVFRVIASDGEAQSFYHMNLQFEVENTAPTLELPEAIQVAVGDVFTYQVVAYDREGDQLTFSEDTDLFEIIASTGQIVLSASATQVGEHNVTFTVDDGVNEVNGSLIIHILEEETEARDTNNASWVVLTAEVALVLVCILFIINFRRREGKEARAAEEREQEEGNR